MAEQIIRHVMEEDWPRLAPLWLRLYEHQRAHGMLLELPPDAFELWRASLQPLLGRFALVLLAEWRGAAESSDSAGGSGLAEATAAPLGFLAGRVRSQPPYFGGQPAGFLSELFVEEAQRGRGVAGALLDASVEWFAARGVVRVELQALVGNPSAREFYRRRGWKEELVQMVWQEGEG
jgi:GNAT superfamily N-acetyltransferase